MGLQRDTFTVYVLGPDEEPQEFTAVITHQDMLRGEDQLVRAGGSDNAKLALVTAWAWASLVRQGNYTGPWVRFRDVDCAQLTKGDTIDVDPTQEAATNGPPSS